VLGEIERILDDGARRESLVYHAMLARTLIGAMRAKGTAYSRCADDLATSLDSVWLLRTQDIVASATPFFWLNVHRMHHLETPDESQYDALQQALALTAFDALFAVLPVGARVAVRPAAEDLFIFPSLGCALPAPPRQAILCKDSATTFLVETPSGPFARVELTQLSRPYRARVHRVSGSTARLLVSRHRALVDEGYADSIALETDDAAFVAMLTEALGLLRATDPSRCARIEQHITWYVPIRSPGGHVHASFTSPGLKGVVFLSPGRDPLQLAEAIVHEHGHNEFNTFLDTRRVFEERAGETFYSPWRTDPRPLSGLLHALHVFCDVLEFLENVAGTGQALCYADQLARRRLASLWRVRIGLAQVPPDRLLGDGFAIVKDLQRRADRQAALLDDPAIPPALLEHRDRWKRENPAARIVGFAHEAVPA
jgi:HEXXH motif-containing protein